MNSSDIIRALERGGWKRLRIDDRARRRDFGVRRATLSDLVNGRASLSPEMALRIEKAFGVSLDLLLRIQALFDSYMVRQHADDLDVKPFASEATVTAGGDK